MLVANLLLAALCVFPAEKAVDPNIAIDLPKQLESPVQIIAVKSTLTDAIAEVTVKNTSDWVVESYQIGWVIIKPSDCPGARMEPMIALAAADDVRLAPNGTATSGSYRLRIRGLLEILVKENSNLLLVQLGIVAVRFADGRTWTYDLASKRIFDPKLLEFYGGRCGPTNFDISRMGSYFTCVHTFSATWCENHYTTLHCAFVR